MFQSGALGFVGDGEASEISERREKLFAALSEKIIGKSIKARSEGVVDDGVIGLVSLDDDVGGIEMAATNAPGDLVEELKSAFFGGKVGEREATVGLDDADGGEQGEIESASEGLGADEYINVAGFDILIEVGKVGFFVIVAVKTGDACVGEKTLELGLEEFCAETFVDDPRMMTGRTRRRDFFGVATDVAGQGISVGVQGHGEVTLGTESLPATIFADG